MASILVYQSLNRKTGNIPQVYILCKDVPVGAYSRLETKAVCNDCPLQKKPAGCGSCYVATHRGPRVVYEAYKGGLYQSIPVRMVADVLPKVVRVGAYGDPLAVPASVWAELKESFKYVLGYTHSWRDKPIEARHWMASCHTVEDIQIANALGLSTFTAVTEQKNIQKVPKRRRLCNNVKESMQCAQCRLCRYTKGEPVNVYIPVHGGHGKETAYRNYGKDKGWL